MQPAVQSLAAAHKEMDMVLFRKHEESSICEDGNKLHNMAGRGYLVKAIDCYSMTNLFWGLKNPVKSEDGSWSDLYAI